MLPDVVIKCRRPLCDDCLNIFGRNRCTQAHYILRRRQAGLAQAELLTNTAFDSIAQHRGAGVFLADHQAEAGARQRQRRRSARDGRRLAAAARAVSSPVDPEVAPAVGACFQRSNEIIRLEKPGCTRKSRSRERVHNGTCNEGLL